ncbi:hypothetical protein C8F01DRAFT_1152867 [Mycena amicta]|nr:hypothetical protein C8F01DRAFT_1152867 [Mycena amicta]
MAALPQVPVGLPAHGVPPPTAPQNPPTLIDVVNALNYNAQLLAAHKALINFDPEADRGPSSPTAVALAEGLMYQKAIMELVEGPSVMPAWFQAWHTNKFQPLVDRTLTNQFDTLRNDHEVFRAQTLNDRYAPGYVAPFVVLPFLNGDDPTDAPHNLPPMHNAGDIEALTAAAITAYLTGYGLSTQGDPIVRTQRLEQHIGYFRPRQ